jgi:hypothetical protein
MLDRLDGVPKAPPASPVSPAAGRRGGIMNDGDKLPEEKKAKVAVVRPPIGFGDVTLIKEVSMRWDHAEYKLGES